MFYENSFPLRVNLYCCIIYRHRKQFHSLTIYDIVCFQNYLVNQIVHVFVYTIFVWLLIICCMGKISLRVNLYCCMMISYNTRKEPFLCTSTHHTCKKKKNAKQRENNFFITLKCCVYIKCCWHIITMATKMVANIWLFCGQSGNLHATKRDQWLW